jgi:hypothetical protein
MPCPPKASVQPRQTAPLGHDDLLEEALIDGEREGN